ncbi:MAG TPA: hypothetical protein VMT17_10750 [Anaeromyxobacteraceae bacterium]|nr:hypothetical protein [Anaeromyxobacteraceae bacterium]
MRAATAVAAWVLVATFPQGHLYQMEQDGSDVMALRAEGTLRAPAWAVREVLARGYKYDRISPYLAERRVLHADGCRDGARELPGCQRVWAYERYEPPVVGSRDYVFRMEIVVDDLDRGGDFEIRWELDDSHGRAPEGVTHMRANRGAWEISPAGAKTRFAYRISADPGGSLPAWIVNLVNRSQIPSVISAVEDEARRLADARAGGR